jgi:hypothetical protein
VTNEEAKEILLPYRHDTSDAEDPQTAEALTVARQDPELARWLEAHCARQSVLTEKFRGITPPEGLIQQIVSEHRATQKRGFLERNQTLTGLIAVMVILICLFIATDPTEWWRYFQGSDKHLAAYQTRMAGVALSLYGMGLATSDTNQIRAYLKQNDAPSDFTLNSTLKQTPMTGCAVEDWHGSKVSMLCFHSNPASGNAHTSDLWLFVANRNLISDAPADAHPRLQRVGTLLVATWTDGDRLYMLARQGDLEDLKKFL